MSYNIDLIEGCDARKTDKGWEASRVAVVYGIDSQESAHARLLVAVTEVNINIDDTHPTFVNSYCREIIPIAITGEEVRIQYIYRPNEYDDISYSLGATGVQEETNQDVDGNDIILKYTWPQDYPEQERAGIEEETGALVSILQPETRLTVHRHEYYDLDNITPITGTILTTRATAYVGTVNQAAWTLRSLDASRTWLCTAITAESSNNGASYDVTYEFSYRIDTWDSTVVFIDPNTGKPPKDLDSDSKKTVQMYPETNFNTLNLS